MHSIDERKLSVLVHSARREAEHPGYVALQPICDLLDSLLAAARRLVRSDKRDRKSRPSLPPHA